MTSIPKDVYIAKLTEWAKIYDNTIPKTIKMNYANIKSETVFDLDVETDSKEIKFKVW